MTIEVRGLGRDRALGARVEQQMGAALERLGVSPITAVVAFHDDDGPRGGEAMRCGITVHLPHHAAVHVEDVAAARRAAFDAAFASLERQLDRYRETDRDLRRRPKKYFAARRALTEEGENKEESRG